MREIFSSGTESERRPSGATSSDGRRSRTEKDPQDFAAPVIAGPLVLGIDTSCYRTSLALVSDGAVVAEQRRLIEVPGGSRGLRQSEALFQHVQHLGTLCEALMRDAPGASPSAVCVSTRPRPVCGSYMPVFTAGEMAARMIAATCGCPLYETSHQQGHLRAALIGSDLPPGAFLAVHLSGGTTEILRVDEGLNVTLLGGTSDLHAGQLVDRVGVAMGLPFPAGPALEALARGTAPRHVMPTANRALSLSLSGAEAQALRMIEAGEPPAQVAAEIYSLLARTLAKLIAEAAAGTGLTRVLIAGGVAASALLRSLLPERLMRLGAPVRICWAEPRWSGDNAAGVALIGAEQWTKERGAGA